MSLSAMSRHAVTQTLQHEEPERPVALDSSRKSKSAELSASWGEKRAGLRPPLAQHDGESAAHAGPACTPAE